METVPQQPDRKTTDQEDDAYRARSARRCRSSSASRLLITP